MKVFVCWLINVCDWVGELSIIYLLSAISEKPTYFAFLNNNIPQDNRFVIAGALMAIIPAIVTAIYATLNYNLVLSWAVVRWMSPLNIITNQFFYFFKTLFLSGAAWAAFITYNMYKWFPNANLDWALPLLRKIADYFYNLFFVYS